MMLIPGKQRKIKENILSKEECIRTGLEKEY
jgi:hypothetical protein